MSTNYINSFENQMEFVRERNRIKYENKLMKEEDLFSQNSQFIFLQQRKLELQKKRREEEERLEQIRFIEKLKEQELFVSNYIINRLNKNSQLNINELTIEAENIFYERLLKQQQDEEYERAILEDSKK
jgi:hypothetical protein